MLIVPLPGNERLADEIAGLTGAPAGVLESRHFPDGESYVRLRSDASGQDVVFVCTLARPDEQFLRLVFAARTARERGARRLTLVAPYLAYMRQDMAFHDGEAVTSVQFADLVSREFDRLVTIDPHLHRHKTLGEIYRIPAEALSAVPLLAAWIAANLPDPLIVGPDVESRQWVEAIGGQAPTIVLRKERRGDRQVELSFPDLTAWRGRQAVVVDDIASSGRTLVQACEGLAARGFSRPACLVVHPLFAEDSFEKLSAVAGRIASTNTVTHASNALSVAGLIAAALA